jgi:ribosomal protein L12E/L44/L45/RPP1/RPP2
VAKKGNLVISEDLDTSVTATIAALDVIISAAFNLCLIVMKAGIERVVENKEVSSHLHDGIRPYLHVVGFLDLMGREINEENITKVVVGLGMKPSKEMMGILISAGVPSDLMYINTFYLLLANGKDINEQSIAGVIKALGIEPDHARIKEILLLCKKYA